MRGPSVGSAADPADLGVPARPRPPRSRHAPGFQGERWSAPSRRKSIGLRLMADASAGDDSWDAPVAAAGGDGWSLPAIYAEGQQC